MKYRCQLSLVLYVILLAATPTCFGQRLHRAHPEFAQQASIEHAAGAVTVTSNSPRPLSQAIDALSMEYGWQINYEDPVYSPTDLIDDTDPTWRASHMQSVGTRIPRGTYFRSVLPEAPNMNRGSQGEQSALEKLIADYNQGGNPGRFEVRAPGDGSYDIVGAYVQGPTGRLVTAPTILDTHISLTPNSGSAFGIIDGLLAQLSLKARTRVEWGTIATNPLAHNVSTSSMTDAPARQVLHQILSQLPRKLVWQLLFDPDHNCYSFNLIPATKIVADSAGNKRTEFLP